MKDEVIVGLILGKEGGGGSDGIANLECSSTQPYLWEMLSRAVVESVAPARKASMIVACDAGRPRVTRVEASGCEVMMFVYIYTASERQTW